MPEEFKTPQQGCSTTLVAALDPSIDCKYSDYTSSFEPANINRFLLQAFSGSYLMDGDVAKEQPPASVTDPALAEKLWILSEKLVGQKFPF